MKFNICWGAILIFFLATSCEKVIDVNLNETSPKIVIESYLENDSTCYAKISVTSSFYNNSSSPAVTDATVRLTDQNGQTELLTHQGNGIYRGTSMLGTIGNTYDFSATVGGNEYTATSTMPPLIPIDSVTSEESSFFGTPGNYLAYINYTDPANIDNYYAKRMRFFDKEEGEEVTLYGIADDNASDGISTRTFGGFQIFEVGDTAWLELSSIDQPTHLYFETLGDALSGRGIASSAPANPTTNLKGGALGYFSAWSKDAKMLIVTQ
jgi:hypothetical protein